MGQKKNGVGEDAKGFSLVPISTSGLLRFFFFDEDILVFSVRKLLQRLKNK